MKATARQHSKRRDEYAIAIIFGLMVLLVVGAALATLI